ncbi:Probable RNA-directed DNA polymerase from transposon X-element [Eumeta japonica]|uniref:Probable RNA-directed DNA polymerase from transposon X-element n=1 Tax=Eumeta variegata TaxID=151549 RepID=A0A4C1SAC3_EUMVA|nr:Probable RNA-directed DNA polymerase from transposon X-element [Eumeta japonica]
MPRLRGMQVSQAWVTLFIRFLIFSSADPVVIGSSFKEATNRIALWSLAVEIHHPPVVVSSNEAAADESKIRNRTRVSFVRGNNKAPGLDGVPNIALKTSIKAASELFLDVYNTCLKEGTFPRKWKQQRLVLLPKGKKPPEEPSSYRPLCMLDTAGKIFERIIHQRIEAIVDPLLADNQYGSRRGRSTLDAISLVVNIAKDAIAGTRWKGGTKEYCLVAALDIRNAFNSANWVCIMQALRGKNVPEYLCRIVASYFTSRVLKYDTKNGPKEYDITVGVPQALFLAHCFGTSCMTGS